jgi:exopolyphosphatase / guanosine-5'-triphosphate,3'-diphosphate pyrophosphatase
MRVAAIDVGTNTTRLLVAETQGSSYRPLDRRLIFTRLGEGVDSERSLSPDALKRTLSAIAEFCSVCGEFEVQKLTIAGTSAVRDAANRDDFLKAAEKLSGAPARVISGDEEARLSFWGATGELTAEQILVCDIGGGSTEFVLGTARGGIQGRISLDIGSVRLTERFLHSDPPATEEILIMEGTIDGALAAVDADLEGCGKALLVGLGGTVTTLAAIKLALGEYDSELIHHHPLGRDDLNRIYRSLAGMALKERSGMPMLPEGRADVIVAGAAILSRIMARWSFDRVVVSEHDILDGLVLEMMGSVR